MVWAAQAPLILSRNSSVDSVTTSPLDDEAASSDEHPAPPPAATAPTSVSTPAVAAPSVAGKLPERIGRVTHYFGQVNAAAIVIESGELRRGDTIHVRGHTTDFYQRVERIERDHAEVEMAWVGQQVGIEVSQRVREGDEVIRVSS